jgi:hypothetical protein
VLLLRLLLRHELLSVVLCLLVRGILSVLSIVVLLVVSHSSLQRRLVLRSVLLSMLGGVLLRVLGGVLLLVLSILLLRVVRILLLRVGIALGSKHSCRVEGQLRLIHLLLLLLLLLLLIVRLLLVRVVPLLLLLRGQIGVLRCCRRLLLAARSIVLHHCCTVHVLLLLLATLHCVVVVVLLGCQVGVQFRHLLFRGGSIMHAACHSSMLHASCCSALLLLLLRSLLLRLGRGSLLRARRCCFLPSGNTNLLLDAILLASSLLLLPSRLAGAGDAHSKCLQHLQRQVGRRGGSSDLAIHSRLLLLLLLLLRRRGLLRRHKRGVVRWLGSRPGQLCQPGLHAGRPSRRRGAGGACCRLRLLPRRRRLLLSSEACHDCCLLGSHICRL